MVYEFGNQPLVRGVRTGITLIGITEYRNLGFVSQTRDLKYQILNNVWNLIPARDSLLSRI